MPIYIPQATNLLGIYRQGQSDRQDFDDRQLALEERREAKAAKAQRDRLLRRALGVGGEQQPQATGLPGSGSISPSPMEYEGGAPGTISPKDAPRWDEQTQSYGEAGAEAPIVAAAQPKRGLDPEAMRELAVVDLETFTKLTDAFSKMDKAELDRHKAKNEALGQVAAYLSNIPMQRRGAELRRVAPQLMAAGWTPDELNNANLTNEGLSSYQALAMDVDKIIDNAASERKFAADQDYRAATLGQGERRIGIAEGALQVARERSARAAAKGEETDNSDLNYLMGGN